MDFRWMSAGGTLLDGNGDIASTLSTQEELSSMAYSRIKAALDGWKGYLIGADLDTYIGQPVNTNTELSIQRAVISALTKDFLAPGTFTVQTVAVGDLIEIYVYLGKILLTTYGLQL